MSNTNARMLSGRSLLVIIIISGLVGAGAGVAGDYISGERHAAVAPQIRDVFLFTDALNFNESILGIPHDIFNPHQISVNLGDTVTIRYFNLELSNENHTFMMLNTPFWTQSSVTVQGAPWNSGNIIVAPNKNVNITFTANQPGVFTYLCTFHQPTMTGYLTVLPP